MSTPGRSIATGDDVELTRTFCGIMRDSAENKTWKTGSHKIIIARNPAFLLLLNKKFSRDLNYTTAESHVALKSSAYHYTDCYESRISHDKICDL
jgi:hypothetical protein